MPSFLDFLLNPNKDKKDDDESSKSKAQKDDSRTSPSASSPVLVTGADGYIAGVLVRELLLLGYTVHATIILPVAKVQYLQNIADESPGSIRFFTANLLETNAFDDAMKDCEIVFHTASPFMMRDGLDVEKDLIEPAVQGTINVLETVNRTSSVKRVIQTSSVGAIYADAIDTFSAPNNILTEDIWNTTSTKFHQPYFLSKKLSERKAWEIAKIQTRWTLIVLNPAMIMGPGIRYHQNSESFRTLVKLAGNGYHFSMWTGIPNFAMPVVDVRDVAIAHLTAAFSDNVPSGRYILCAANSNFPLFAKWLREKYPNYPIPAMVSKVPRWFAAIIAPYTKQGLDSDTVRNNVDIPINLDNTKSRQILKLQYRDPKLTLQEMYQQLIDEGVVKPGGPRPEMIGISLLVVLLAVFVGIVLQLLYSASSSGMISSGR